MATGAGRIVRLAHLRSASARARRRIARTALSGRVVHCPLCGWGGRRWWKADRCPSCGSFPRHRFLPEALAHFGRLPGEAGVLVHVGSGPVDASYLRGAGAGVVVRVDLHPLDAEVVGDLSAVPLRDGSVDLAVAWHVFEHVDDDLAAADGLRRALRPSGAAVVSVPVHPFTREVTLDGGPEEGAEERLARHGDADHVRSCGRDYGARLASVGFDLATLRAGDLPPATVARLGLEPDHHAWCLTPR